MSNQSVALMTRSLKVIVTEFVSPAQCRLSNHQSLSLWKVSTSRSSDSLLIEQATAIIATFEESRMTNRRFRDVLVVAAKAPSDNTWLLFSIDLSTFIKTVHDRRILLLSTQRRIGNDRVAVEACG